MMAGNRDVTINGVRFSYCHLIQPQERPNQDPKYGVTILLPQHLSAEKAKIDQAINSAIEDGITRCWNGSRPPLINICVYDGNGTRPSDGETFGAECKGHWVFTASCKDKPFIVDANVQNIINPSDVYSGMYGNVSVRFFPYSNNGKKGIGCYLNGVQKVADGEPLGNRVTAEDAFKPVSQEAAASYGAAPQPGYAAPGYTPPPTAPSAPPAAYTTAPGTYPAASYSAAPAAPSAPYGAVPGMPPQNPYPQQNAWPQQGGYPQQPPAAPQFVVDPNAGEVLGGYQPAGFPVAGI